MSCTEESVLRIFTPPNCDPMTFGCTRGRLQTGSRRVQVCAIRLGREQRRTKFEAGTDKPARRAQKEAVAGGEPCAGRSAVRGVSSLGIGANGSGEELGGIEGEGSIRNIRSTRTGRNTGGGQSNFLASRGAIRGCTGIREQSARSGRRVAG